MVGVFESLDQASDAVTRLGEAGFPMEPSLDRGSEPAERAQDARVRDDRRVAKEGAKWGAVFGGLFGLLFGAAFLAIPGFGPLIILGPLAAGVVGAAEGAVGTGLVGAILGAFLFQSAHT